MPRALKWTGVVLLAALIVAASAVLGPRLAGTTKVETELGRISVRVQPALGGGLEGYVPVADWGIHFEGPPIPFRMRAELRSLNRETLLRAADGDLGLVDRTEAKIRDGARDAALRALAWSLATALVILLVAAVLLRSLRPRWALPAIGLAIFVLATLTLGLAARNSLNQESFENPTYFASGEELKRILEVVDQEDVESPYGTEFESIVRSLGAVLATGEETVVTGDELYLGSDLHANPLVIRPVSRLVDDRPLLLTGDFGQRGSTAEAAILVPRVAALGRRVVAVSGNHDSTTLMRRLAAGGITVLDGDGRLMPDGSFQPPPVIEVGGVDVAGWGDPLEYGGEDRVGDRAVTSDDLDDPEAALDAWADEIFQWFDSLAEKPDVVMVHQHTLARRLAEELVENGYSEPLTIATGHSHEQRLERVGPVVIVNPGSIGAGGVFDAGETAIGIAHLRFGEDGALRSAELISVEPFSGAARATRVVIDSLCPEELRCSAVIPEEMVTG